MPMSSKITLNPVEYFQNILNCDYKFCPSRNPLLTHVPSPLSEMTTICLVPHVILTMNNPSRLSTSVGIFLRVLSPCPISQSPLLPHVNTLPSFVSAAVRKLLVSILPGHPCICQSIWVRNFCRMEFELDTLIRLTFSKKL